MKWRRFAWLIVFWLAIAAVWAIIDIRGKYEKIAAAESADLSDPARRLVSLRKTIAEHEDRLESLEKLAVWPPGTDPGLHPSPWP